LQNPSQYATQLAAQKRQLKKLDEDLVPRTGSLFVRLFLGQVNVKNYQDGERFRLKEEYQKFKGRTDWIFLIFSSVLLFLGRTRWMEILFQCWLVYYFVSLSLRENILQVNGSRIKDWWIFHHYISIVVSITWLTWNTITYEASLNNFLWLTFFQGVVQLLQNFYQSSKLYKMVAMGKADRMHVYTGEDSSALVADSNNTFLLALFPCLIGLQSLQLYTGFNLIRTGIRMHYTEFQIYLIGVLFLALGCGNMFTTLTTYKEKIWPPQKQKKN